jgi:hypothetical protein
MIEKPPVSVIVMLAMALSISISMLATGHASGFWGVAGAVCAIVITGFLLITALLDLHWKSK